MWKLILISRNYHNKKLSTLLMSGRTNRYSFSFTKVSVWNANLWNDNLGCKCHISKYY